MSKKVVTRPMSRQGQTRDDRVAVEEPLEIRVASDTVAITMRTPGDDPRLALGFLLSEGIIASAADVGTVSHCGKPTDEGYGNVIEVTPASGARLQLEKLETSRRGTLTTSACGVCGRRTIDDLLATAGPVPDGPLLDRALIARSPVILRVTQATFELTGGVHGAAVLSPLGEVLSSAEDVGRHNAVDKALGALLQQGRVPARRGDGEPAVLVVSGRCSFELVQKAAVARLACIASVSAASSLAIDLAERMNLTLATFVRNGEFNLYTHPERFDRALPQS
ncbi:MAG: formate dehydrogenase accessory sulfurtransferase FdhD [Archangiaceae bacterium]|nr:formate dehydrogenase accessory sulfurtransferase FdhD [Archangiaceae bacterium]